VSESSVLTRISEARGSLEAGENCIHNEELHNLYVSKNIIGMIKSRRIR
jgi:hypothetical protein